MPAKTAWSWNALNFALTDWAGWTEEAETVLLVSILVNKVGEKCVFCSEQKTLGIPRDSY
jgi:hypothetical protein